jgi:hypothetical protein
VNEFRARIRRVRMKGGGADVHIVEGFTPPPDGDESVEATLCRTAREYVEDGSLAAFMLIGFAPDGRVLFNWRYTDDCPMARTLMPSYMAELARRYVVTREEASARFKDMFEWVE